MADPQINNDFSSLAVVHTADIDWQPSPSGTVWRKRLDLSGPAEAGRVTSVVRYDPESRFPSHPHPDGEEILVLEGVFSDEHGDYPAGSYLLNPQGFSHAPFSKEGCRLFVKLRQYPGTDRRKIAVNTKEAAWRPAGPEGAEVQDLYSEEGQPERMRLLRLTPGAAIESQIYLGGQEIFLLEGDLWQPGAPPYKAGSWARYPAGSRHALKSEGGCLFYEKTGHLSA